jgi:hypothetical protein
MIIRSLALGLALTLSAAPASAQPNLREPMTCASAPDPGHDGQHDFDWEHGEWTTHLWLLQNPLSGAGTWVEYNGVSNVRGILGGRANIVELSVEGPAGRIEGMSLRLYSPQARQWSLNFANMRVGELTTPVIGAFSDSRGEFYGQDTLNGRAILVRFVIQQISRRSARFEQAFSADGGRTWEVNWIAMDTRR